MCDDPEEPTAGPSRRFRIEVGFADGRVAEIPGDTGCSTRDLTLFSQLETTLLMQAAGTASADEVAPVRCPQRFTTTATNADGSSAGWLVDVADQWRVGMPGSDAIRAEATTGYMDGIADCDLQPRATSYVVVLHDATGTARTLTIDPTACSPMSAAIGTPPVDTYLGLASQRLVRLVRDSRTT